MRVYACVYMCMYVYVCVDFLLLGILSVSGCTEREMHACASGSATPMESRFGRPGIGEERWAVGFEAQKTAGVFQKVDCKL